MYCAKYLLISVLALAGMTSSFALLFYHAGGHRSPLTETAQVNLSNMRRETQAAAPAPETENATTESDDSARARADEAYGKLPLSFEANQGQADAEVKFLSRGQGYGLFLTSNEAVLALSKSATKNAPQAVVRMQLLGANSAPRVEGGDELAGKSNYFIGNDPAKWQTEVANYGSVRYSDVYPGIDLVYYGNQRQLEYDFVVAPGVDPRHIALGFRGVEKLKVDGEGNLVLKTAGGEIRQHKPVVYQEVDGARRNVAGNYVIKGEREVGFEVADYDATRQLVIDPVLVYSTYLSGRGADSGYGIDVDAKGIAYVTGTTISTDFPVSKAAQTKIAVLPGTTRAYYNDAFVTKLNATGTALVYSTFLGGGRAGDVGMGIAADAAGNAYVTGNTVCSPCVNDGGPNDFPVLNAHQSAAGDPQDAFVTKLNATGGLVYSTFLGGSSGDYGQKIVVNTTSGEAYVAGTTGAPGFPTTPGAYKQSTCSTCLNGTSHAFVTKYNAAGSVQWATLIGVGYANDIALDSAGNTYLTGTTTGTSFPATSGAFQTKNSGGTDAFVTKLNATGTDLVYSTYLGGGTQSDRGFGIDVDAAGNAYVTGQTQSAAFPVTPGAFDVSYNGGEDAFVTKLNATGTDLVYSTFLGGNLQDAGRGIALDNTNNAYVTGQTKAANFPTKNSLQLKTSTAEIFLTKLNPAGNALIYSTFLGAGDGRDVAVTGGSAFLTGQASLIPLTLNAFQTIKTGANTNANYDAFVMKVNPANEAAQIYTISGHITDNVSDGVTVPTVLTLTGKQNRTTNINSAGNYSFGALPAGAYTVTASKKGFEFDPPSQTINIVSTNQTANFTVAANNDPVATLTGPADNSTYTTPANITVTATASDSDGSVAKVEFYANTTSGTVFIGTDTVAPYSATWSNAPAGNHVLSAMVTDNLGARAQADNLLAVTVRSSVAPTVAITSPANNSTFRARDNIQVNANVTAGAGATISYVEFYAGTTVIARKTESPYSFIWSPTEAGTFSVTAKAFDNGGAMTTSSPVTVTITPAVSTFNGHVSDGTSFMSGVLVTLTGTRNASVVTGADGKYSFADLPAEGAYTVTPSKDGYTFEPASVSTDFLGYYGRTEYFRGIRNTPVSVQITSPSWFAQYTAPASIKIDAAASSTAGTITAVDFFYTTTGGPSFHIGTDTTAPYSFTWTNAPAGDYYIYAMATDSTSETNTSESTPIKVNPTPTIVSIHGQVTDGGGTGMSGVRVSLSGSRTATALTIAGGYYAFGDLPSGGSYTVTAPPNYTFTPPSHTFNNLTEDQLDADFNTTSFNSAPTVALTSPANNSTYNAPADIQLSATASDSDGTVTRVNFYSGGVMIGADTSAPYGFIWGVNSPGTYTITAIAIDNGGLRKTSTAITITVKQAPTAQLNNTVMDGIVDVIRLSNGSFQTGLLSAGDYTLTSSRADNIFAPASWTITEPGSDKAFDFNRTLAIQPSDFNLTANMEALPSGNSAWFINRTPQGLSLSRQWTEQGFTDLAVQGDYDGDGQTDLAIYHPGDGSWYLLRSSS
jgi:hypothetical protein